MSLVHECHAHNCIVEVEPKFLMCKSHWEMVPSYLQSLIYQMYQSGQEVSKSPSRTWLKYARQAIEHVAELEKESETN